MGCAAWRLVPVSALLCAPLAAQSPFPAPPAALPSHPFFVKKTWIIGGAGNWDSLTMDPVAQRLYIAHSHEVQIVDVETGQLAGSVNGLMEAHAIALDSTGEFGYVSDGKAGDIKIFDRRTLQVQAKIPLDSSPRGLVFEPQTGLLLAVSAGPPGAPPPTADSRTLAQYAMQQWQETQRREYIAFGAGRRPEPPSNPCSTDSRRPGAAPAWESNLILIDPEARKIVAEIRLCGFAGFAQADGQGNIYATQVSGDNVLRIDASAVLNLAQSARQSRSAPNIARLHGSLTGATLHLDWRDGTQYVGGHGVSRLFDGLTVMGLGGDCHTPRALAVDSKDHRVFVACNNLKMAVLNAIGGDVVTSLPIGPGPEAVGYDRDRDLIFVANGGGDGTLTIIQRDLNDSYAVIQNLLTRQQARTLAVNSSNDQVYLVTAYQVAKLGPPPLDGIGSLKLAPDESSFQVLVVGN